MVGSAISLWVLSSSALIQLHPRLNAPSSLPLNQLGGIHVQACATAPSRDGYAIQHEFVIAPHIADDTPLPAALVASNSTRFPTMTQARKACRRGSVLVNGRESRCLSAVSAGDLISLQCRVNPGYAPRGAPPFPVEVVWEDDHLAVVIKPAGVVSHPPPGGAAGSRSMRTAVMHALEPPEAGTREAGSEARTELGRSWRSTMPLHCAF